MSLPTTRPDTDAPERGDVVSRLTRIWSRLLDLPEEEIAPATGFLALGGDSVLAVRMAALVRQTFSVDLGLADVRVDTTIDALADVVLDRCGAQAGGETAGHGLDLAVEHDPDEGRAFGLLPLQQGYFVGQHDGWELSYPTAHHYLDLGLTDVDPYDAPVALQDALARLVAHQPMLRARVHDDGTQRILPLDDPDAVPQVTVVDLRDASDIVADVRLRQIRGRLRRVGPDPRKGPALDVWLTLLPGGAGRLHAAVSLMIIDGWSANVFYRELFSLLENWNAILPPLGITYGDYVTALQQLPEQPAYRADRDWWVEKVPTLPYAPALPLEADPRDISTDVMGARSARLPAHVWTRVREQCVQHGVTPSVALFTVFAAAISRECGHRRMLLNSLQLNRLPVHPDVQRIVGGFATTMLVPVELTRGATFVDAAKHCQERFAESMDHALFSGVEVTRELGRHRGTQRPLAPVIFQSTLGVDAAMGSEMTARAGALGTVDYVDHEQQLRTPQVALETRLYEMAGEVFLVFSQVDEIFPAGLVDRLFDAFVSGTAALADPGGWLAVPALPEDLDPPADDTLRLGRYDAEEPAAAAVTSVDLAGGPLRDDVERRVAERWEQVCDEAVDDRSANFFAAGGDSLLAVRLVGSVARAEGVTLSVRDFLLAPTVAGLAHLVRAARDAAAPEALAG